MIFNHATDSMPGTYCMERIRGAEAEECRSILASALASLPEGQKLETEELRGILQVTRSQVYTMLDTLRKQGLTQRSTIRLFRHRPGCYNWLARTNVTHWSFKEAEG